MAEIDPEIVEVLGEEGLKRRREAALELRAREQMTWIATALGTYEGRYMVWRFLEYCAVFHANPWDETITMAKQEGKRSIGLRIIEDIWTANPNAYMEMRVEADKRLAQLRAINEEAGVTE